MSFRSGPGRSLAEGWPGIALCAAVAVAATAVNTVLPLVSAMLVAILVGLLARNLGLIPVLAEPGLKVTARTVLRAGVVLLGLRLSGQQKRNSKKSTKPKREFIGQGDCRKLISLQRLLYSTLPFFNCRKRILKYTRIVNISLL